MRFDIGIEFRIGKFELFDARIGGVRAAALDGLAEMIPLLQKHAMITRGIVSPDGGVLVRRKKIKAFPDDFENWKIPCPLIEFARFVQDNAELDFRIDPFIAFWKAR